MQYDPAIGRWGQIDPLAEGYVTQSPYDFVLNNPLKYIDPDGMRVINGHQQARDETDEAHKKAQAARDNYSGDSKKEIRKLDRAVKRTGRAAGLAQSRFDAAQGAISELQTGNPELYEALDNLQGQNGVNVDVVVRVQSELTSEVTGSEGFLSPTKVNGLTDTQLLSQGVSQDFSTGKKTPYATVQSSSGPNTATIFLDINSANGKTLSHEGGHTRYNVQNFYSYLLWLKQNRGKSSGGHGGGNPSGLAADREEQIYIQNTKKD